MFDYNRIEKCDNYNNSIYYFYLHSDEPFPRLINNSPNLCNKNVCLIKDSFNVVVAPFLALAIKDLTLLDPRNFTGSVKNFLEKERFDLVIVACTTFWFTGENKLLDFD